MIKSKRTDKQEKIFRVKRKKKDPDDIDTATLRFDDRCGNGHNTFSATAEGKNIGGQCHDLIVKHFPRLEKYLKWHLTSTDGPMYYVKNTVYLAGNRDCYGLELFEERGMVKPDGSPILEWRSDCGMKPYQLRHTNDPEKKEITFRLVQSMRIGEGKERELDAARSCAVWPEATDAELCADPKSLKETLAKRLPDLMSEFHKDMIELGFEY